MTLRIRFCSNERMWTLVRPYGFAFAHLERECDSIGSRVHPFITKKRIQALQFECRCDQTPFSTCESHNTSHDLLTHTQDEVSPREGSQPRFSSAILEVLTSDQVGFFPDKSCCGQVLHTIL